MHNELLQMAVPALGALVSTAIVLGGGSGVARGSSPSVGS